MKQPRYKMAGGLAALMVMGGMVWSIPAADASVFDGGDRDLGDLVILDQLFNQGDGLFDSTRSVVVRSGDTLSQIALDTLGDASRYPEIATANNIADPDLIYPGQVLAIPAANTSILHGNGSDLGDLIILDELFSDNDSIIGDNDNDLGDLIILDMLFGNNNGIFGNGDGTGSDLGNLIILDELFSDDDNIIGGKDNDLGDLFILDMLFNDGDNNMSNLGDLFILERLFD